MRIVIVGPGALGSLLAARISLYLDRQGNHRADNDIHLCLLDHKQERAAYLLQHGLVLEDGDRKHHIRPLITIDPGSCSGADVIFMCTKSTVLDSVLMGLRSYLSAEQLLIAMQNGIGHLEPLHNMSCHVGVGITSEGATLIAPGLVRHGGAGITRLGLLHHKKAAVAKLLQRVADLLSKAGMASQITDDPLRYIWAKLLVNTGINALTAIHGCRNGGLLDSPATRSTMEMAVREAEQVARALKIPIDSDPVTTTLEVCAATGSNISSMLQDVRNHRRTEIDAINGAVVAVAEHLGIATPVNRELVRQVKAIEAGYSGNADCGGQA